VIDDRRLGVDSEQTDPRVRWRIFRAALDIFSSVSVWMDGWRRGKVEAWAARRGGDHVLGLDSRPFAQWLVQQSPPPLPSPPLCARERERERERAGCLALFHSINVAATSQPQALQVHCTNCVCREQCQWSIPFHSIACMPTPYKSTMHRILGGVVGGLQLQLQPLEDQICLWVCESQ
jgi:hypothetical protein